MFLQPEYVEIITWNDFGESHYIGPLRDNSYTAFDQDKGNAPFNYALGKDHDGWRNFLPYVIDMAKTNQSSFSQEMVTAWYRQNPSSACGTGGTTGNTASQLQTTYSPAEIVEDKIVFAALLGSSATVSVTVGGTSLPASWAHVPSNNVGLYRGDLLFGSATGDVVVTITRDGAQVAQIVGKPISTTCANGLGNWNANVEFSLGNSIAAASPLGLDQSVCTGGIGDAKYEQLCQFACKYDYCPRGACTCTSMGAKLANPVSQDVHGCPAEGKDQTYLGLCSFACNYGYCPDSCKIYPASHVCEAPLPTAPPVPVCVAGMADGAYSNLCSMSCFYGFCPPEICTCTQAGVSTVALPADTGMVGTPIGASDYGLCAWTCRYGKCPADLCNCSGTGCPTSAVAVFREQLSNPSQKSITKNVATQLASSCVTESQCTDQTDMVASACPDGLVKIGWDKGGCKADHGKSVCCAANSRFTRATCLWRGDVTECNGQCHPGEVMAAKSSWGGQPTQGNNKKCIHGVKALCCASPDYALVTRGCRWTSCGGHCNTKSEVQLLEKTEDLCFSLNPSKRYCCPSPALLYDCHWRGKAPDCADAKCLSDEIEVDQGTFGSSSARCLWGRKKVGCCKMDAPAPPDLPDNCAFDVCTTYPELCDIADDDAWGATKRDIEMGLEPRFDELDSDSQFYHVLEERKGRAREYIIDLPALTAETIILTAWKYPTLSNFPAAMKRAGLSVISYALSDNCGEVALQVGTAVAASALEAYTVDHPLDLQLIKLFIICILTNELSGSAGQSQYAAIPVEWVLNTFINDLGLPAEATNQVSATSPKNLRSPMKLIFEAVGSNTNLSPFVLLQKGINISKGSFFGLKAPVHSNPKKSGSWQELVANGLDNPELVREWDSVLKWSIGIFLYLQQSDAWVHFRSVQLSIRAQLVIIAKYTIGAVDLVDKWDEWFDSHMIAVQDFAQTWVKDRIIEAMTIVDQYNGQYHSQQMVILLDHLSQIGNIWIPGYRRTGS